MNFWKLKKQIENQKQKDPYDTITEDGKKITDPQETKDYIAGYYEQLYQAREGTQEYEKWTNHIKHTVRKIEKTLEKAEPPQTIDEKEINNAIKKLKRKKAQDPITYLTKYSLKPIKKPEKYSEKRSTQ